VLVYGNRTVFDAAAAYGLKPAARRVVYCNYVVSKSRPRSGDGHHEPLVLMTGGGGRDSFPVAEVWLQALPRLGREAGIRSVILTGPNMLPGDRDALVARSAPYARVEAAVGNAEAWIEKASAVLTLGGYNSVCEVLKWRKKALVVPRPGPSAEQRTRSHLFAQRDLIRVLEPEALTPARLADALGALMRDDIVPAERNLPALDGAERSASVILDGFVSDDAPRGDAMATEGAPAAASAAPI
jgi:predicted glycosyltransferase